MLQLVKLANGTEEYIHVPDVPEEPIPAETVESLKAQLEATDYKIIKSAEYQLLGLPPPYDLEQLHADRQALRDKINQLEEL